MAISMAIAGRIPPTGEQRGDVAFGWPLLVRLAELEAASALAVREGDVIAVCAAEPLEAMIRRAGQLCRRRGWTLLVSGAAAGGQDGPPAGAETIRRLRQARGGCLALGAGAGADADLLAAADRARIAVLQIE